MFDTVSLTRDTVKGICHVVWTLGVVAVVDNDVVPAGTQGGAFVFPRVHLFLRS